MKEKIQQQFNFVVKWKAGKRMFISDALSRSPVSDPPKDNAMAEVEVPNERFIVSSINSQPSEGQEKSEEFGDMNLVRLLEIAKKDKEYQKLIKIVQKGCLRKKEMPEKLREFWTSLNRLSIFNGFVLMNRKRIVIPNDAKDDILKELHVAHQGIERTKRRARETVYWPNIDKDIAQVVSSCDACRQRLPSQPKEEMLEDGQVPTKPFECVGADLFTIAGKEYLAYIDRLSGWPVVHAFNKAGITTADVIKPIRKTFMDHGIPKVFESDNGPQFASTGFQSFLKEWGIKWRSSSPYYPQSNGLAENGVKKLKGMVIKIIEERGHLDEDVLTRAMIELRNTPVPFGVSPATVVYGYEL